MRMNSMALPAMGFENNLDSSFASGLSPVSKGGHNFNGLETIEEGSMTKGSRKKPKLRSSATVAYSSVTVSQVKATDKPLQELDNLNISINLEDNPEVEAQEAAVGDAKKDLFAATHAVLDEFNKPTLKEMAAFKKLPQKTNDALVIFGNFFRLGGKKLHNWTTLQPCLSVREK